MKRTISGNELRDRLLSRMKLPEDSESTEEMRIQVLSSSGNRELLEIVATKQPRSISELATLARRLQPNVSRSLSALARAGLLTMTLDGRASVPTLTSEGRRKAQDLGFVARASLSMETSHPIPNEEEQVLSTSIAGSPDGDLATDAVQSDVTVRFPMSEGQFSVTAHALLNLTEICTNLLANWWRVLCKRGDPFKMFPVEKETNEGMSQAILLAESTGQMTLFVRSMADDRDAWGFPRLSLTGDDFTRIVLDRLVRPLVSYLRAGRRFDRPVESLLGRTEEILHHPADLSFWRTAGALGLSYERMTDTAVVDVTNLISAISNEDARLDLASASSPDQISQSLGWIEREIEAKVKKNNLPRLIELRNGAGTTAGEFKPWRIGIERARHARKQIGFPQDRSVGGINGLAKTFGGDSEFMPSSAGEELLRGYLGRGDEVPVVVVREEGPKSTAFLLSRAIGDYLVFGNREAPIADIYSDRQAVGRAFAAEFMAPAEGVVQMIEDEGQPLDAVAEHYGVGREVVRRQYENNIAQYARVA